MTISFDNFEVLKRQIEDLKRRRDKASGARDLLLKKLKKEFGCKSIDQANKLLEKLLAKEDLASTRYHTAMGKYKKSLKRAAKENKEMKKWILEVLKENAEKS